MTTWVLLRGLTREARHWGSFASELARRLDPGDEVIALDLPGNGAMNAAASPASVPAMALACRESLASRRLPPPYVLVAMSLGGMVALEWANEFPDEVAGGVLINTSLRGHSPFWQRLRPRSYWRLCRLLLPGLSPIEREFEVLALTSSSPRRHGGVPAQWAAMAKERPVGRFNALRQLAAGARYVPPSKPPNVPVLVLASAGDDLVAPRCSERFAAHWNLPLRMHPSAGHDLALDDAEWVLQQIMAWWKNMPGWRRCCSG